MAAVATVAGGVIMKLFMYMYVGVCMYVCVSVVKIHFTNILSFMLKQNNNQ